MNAYTCICLGQQHSSTQHIRGRHRTCRLNWQLHFGEPPKWAPDVKFILVDTAASDRDSQKVSHQPAWASQCAQIRPSPIWAWPQGARPESVPSYSAGYHAVCRLRWCCGATPKRSRSSWRQCCRGNSTRSVLPSGQMTSGNRCAASWLPHCKAEGASRSTAEPPVVRWC